jgi:hypothetical protein
MDVWSIRPRLHSRCNCWYPTLTGTDADVRQSRREAEVLVMIIVGWMLVLPALVVAALYLRSSVSRVTEREPVDGDGLVRQIAAFATAGRKERRPEPAASAPRPSRSAGARSGY